jgi:hypothetical protein
VYNIVEFPLSQGGFSPEFYRRFVVEIPPLFEGTCDSKKFVVVENPDWRKFHRILASLLFLGLYPYTPPPFERCFRKQLVMLLHLLFQALILLDQIPMNITFLNPQARRMLW